MLNVQFARDTFLLGRVTYQGFAAAWLSRMDEMEFTNRVSSLPKHVVSTILKEAS